MNSTISKLPDTAAWGTGAITGGGIGYPLRHALRELLKAADIPGIDSVRLLASDERYWGAHDKVFFVLGTHDIDRDERIITLMMQFERVDYDLVPLTSAGMVPGAAVHIC